MKGIPWLVCSDGASLGKPVPHPHTTHTHTHRPLQPRLLSCHDTLLLNIQLRCSARRFLCCRVIVE